MSGPIMIVIVGTQKSGRGTLYNSLVERLPMFRRPRVVACLGESESEEYTRLKRARTLIETVSAPRQGIDADKLAAMLEAGEDVVCEADTSGAARIKRRFPECVTIAATVSPSSDCPNEGGGCETQKVRRAAFDDFDYAVAGDIRSTIDSVLSIAAAERCRTHRLKA